MPYFYEEGEFTTSDPNVIVHSIPVNTAVSDVYIRKADGTPVRFSGRQRYFFHPKFQFDTGITTYGELWEVLKPIFIRGRAAGDYDLPDDFISTFCVAFFGGTSHNRPTDSAVTSLEMYPFPRSQSRVRLRTSSSKWRLYPTTEEFWNGLSDDWVQKIESQVRFLNEPLLRYLPLEASSNSNPSSGSQFMLCPDVDPTASPIKHYDLYSFDFNIGGWHVTPRIVDPFHDEQWGVLKNYTFKMNPTSYKFFRHTEKEQPNRLMFGLELEMSTRIKPFELNYIVKEMEPKQEPFFCFKSDSSVGGEYRERYEIVTVPCSPKYLKENFRILFSKLELLVDNQSRPLSYYFDLSPTLSNGIHIHVSKDAFEGDTHKHRFSSLFNLYNKDAMEFLSKVSSRSEYWNNRFCFISPKYKGYTTAFRLKNLSAHSEDRHSVCHSLNTETVEVRLFQGIVNLKHIHACIEFTEAMFNFSQFCSYKVFSQAFVKEFTNWLFQQQGYRNIKERTKR
jgi:hypothetical protein